MKINLLLIINLLSVELIGQQMDVQGNRGCRGLLPENSMPAFINALELGVTSIELDVVISKDGQVVVSHEPFLNPIICLDPDGKPIENESQYNLFQMNYSDIALCDCGSRGNVEFPDQEKMKVVKPLLSDVIKGVEWHIKSYTQYEVDYIVEIKSERSGDGKFHPIPKEFSDIVYQLIDKYLPWERVVVQSFDFRVLKYWNKTYPTVRVAALVENTKSIETNLANLGFNPDIYSPYHNLLSKESINNLHARDIKIVPWTVNDTTRMKELVEWGIDGFNTDYPDSATTIGLINRKREAIE